MEEKDALIVDVREHLSIISYLQKLLDDAEQKNKKGLRRGGSKSRRKKSKPVEGSYHALHRLPRRWGNTRR
jgi:hypothetical protein